MPLLIAAACDTTEESYYPGPESDITISVEQKGGDPPIGRRDRADYRRKGNYILGRNDRGVGQHLLCKAVGREG